MSGEHETIKYQFNDGFKAVRLTTMDALYRFSSGLLGKLVTNKYFDEAAFHKGELQFISIRDGHDNTVLTMVILDNECFDMAGRGALGYDDRLSSWLNKLAKHIMKDKPASLFNRVPQPDPQLLRYFQTVISHSAQDAASRNRVEAEIGARYAKLSEALGFDVDTRARTDSAAPSAVCQADEPNVAPKPF